MKNRPEEVNLENLRESQLHRQPKHRYAAADSCTESAAPSDHCRSGRCNASRPAIQSAYSMSLPYAAADRRQKQNPLKNRSDTESRIKPLPRPCGGFLLVSFLARSLFSEYFPPLNCCRSEQTRSQPSFFMIFGWYLSAYSLLPRSCGVVVILNQIIKLRIVLFIFT